MVSIFFKNFCSDEPESIIFKIDWGLAKVCSLWGSIVNLTEYIRLGCYCLMGTNMLAYYTSSLTIAVQRFIVQARGKAGNPYQRGRLFTVDLLIKIAYFVTNDKYVFTIKSSLFVLVSIIKQVPLFKLSLSLRIIYKIYKHCN